MWIVVGLGNPGKKYAAHRHNIGFLVADELARRHHFAPAKQKHGSELCSGTITGERVALVKPMEFMNVSGYAVQRAMGFFRVAPEQAVVIHDDIDLDFATVRVKAGGGHGGHNGLRSIIDQTGSRDFVRVRVGVGKPEGAQSAGKEERDRRVADYVLSPFPHGAESEVADAIGRAADAVEIVLARGAFAAMNEVNGKAEQRV
ncbi:MAG TPA: aminoacyl-tRNA hydrolase [Kofleriaceae bacterium]|nr:aminoacyl-tRNA hydrolase [Kofleriaceae bacterium]